MKFRPLHDRVLVFTRTKHGADRVVRHLVGAGIEATAIHGNKSQPQRERALAGFRDGQTRVLVATDIAARGIDVDGVSHVINFELPNVPEDYVHRVGRTARAGAAGIAIAFCSDEENSRAAKSPSIIWSLASCVMRPQTVPFGQTISSPSHAISMSRVLAACVYRAPSNRAPRRSLRRPAELDLVGDGRRGSLGSRLAAGGSLRQTSAVAGCGG